MTNSICIPLVPVKECEKVMIDCINQIEKALTNEHKVFFNVGNNEIRPVIDAEIEYNTEAEVYELNICFIDKYGIEDYFYLEISDFGEDVHEIKRFFNEFFFIDHVDNPMQFI